MAFNPKNSEVPKWYSKLMDAYISTADRHAKSDDVIADGFSLPDADGSRSSLATREAELNNTFDYDILVESLEEIYANSSNHLIAANNDNVGFYQWHGKLSDMRFTPATDYCEFRIPHSGFIKQADRDRFKKSQFYRKWIRVEDILNNWDVFRCHIMLFINQRVYSEYELNISEQETLIRFKYDEYWKKNDAKVSLYKFDTNYQKRVFISRELYNNQWRQKLPVDYIDSNIGKYSYVVAAINKISNRKYRTDNPTHVDVLGDNLEFLPIVDGYIDLSLLSKFNKNYINSETKEFLWLSLFVPKFMFEYPSLLPTDIVHRPYPMNIKPVVALRNDIPQDVHTEEDRKVYIDVDGKIFEPYNGWLQTIRPIVLSDAYKAPIHEPLEKLIQETRHIRDLCTVAADTVEEFKDYSKEASPDEDKIKEYADKLYQDIVNVKNALYAFYDRRLAERDSVYEYIFTNQFSVAIEDIKAKGMNSYWINPHAKWEMKIWEVSSPLIYIPRELIMKYSVIEVIHGMKRKLVYGNHDKLINKVRFQRPVEASNFWTFEYDPVDAVWRPFPLKVEHHFPDAYTFKDENDPNVTLGRVFKAFMFYSDTINTSALTKKLEKPAPQWERRRRWCCLRHIKSCL